MIERKCLKFLATFQLKYPLEHLPTIASQVIYCYGGLYILHDSIPIFRYCCWIGMSTQLTDCRGKGTAKYIMVIWRILGDLFNKLLLANILGSSSFIISRPSLSYHLTIISSPLTAWNLQQYSYLYFRSICKHLLRNAKPSHALSLV